MSASISQKKDGASSVLTPVSPRRVEIILCFAFSLRIRLPPHLFYKTIDAFSGCLYPLRHYISRRPCGKLPNDEIYNTIKIPLDFHNYRLTWPFENRIQK